MTISAPVAFGLALHRPRWALAAALAALVTASFCWPLWPGLMSYDSVYAYTEARLGVETMLWPPAHAYLFWISERLGAGPGGLFAAQTSILFFAAALIFSLAVKRAPVVIMAFVAFTGAFVLFPPLLGSLAAQWRDVTTASFTLLGIALWLAAAQVRSKFLLAGAAAAFSLALALRYNAFPLVFALLGLMVLQPFGEASGARIRLAALAFAALGCALAYASTVWRLPDLARPPPPQAFSATQAFDLIGMSACLDRSLLPPAVTADKPISGDQLRRAYDPRHLQLAYQPRDGVPPILQTDGAGAVQAAWRREIPRQWRCYLAHRTLVLVEQLGMAKRGVFYPVHGGIDANRFGVRLSRPEAAAQVGGFVERNSQPLWRRPFVLHALAGLIALAACFASAPGRLILAAGWLGSAAYVGLLFVVAPAADARYIFPPNAICALIVVLGVICLSRRRAGR
ncbi:hypothetical protein [Phenylobacterium sp.]|uniref:hypothetical protein n=1 Tax=Phenylobacterium sp. TaxID=1871053 RepID=UPI0027353C6A|nr:hypothetical protein [Phenylobacterium sp.]MDP3660865.1 hypothetical protein [Phenylobacterium sp.]